MTRAAQRTVLAASEQRFVATDLTGPSSLVRLVDRATDSTVALLQAEELSDLQKRYATPNSGLVLRLGQAPLLLGWEERRLLRALLRGDNALPVRAVGPSAPFRLPPG
ncbi:monogalactosyldiacylglycerol synthase [Arthrobacter sp. Hiyo8]|nr:monogalactosyldiacylglycerol synthase [Arthrobacter sp. Hiyo8]